MNNTLLLLTHGKVGEAMKEAAKNTLGIELEHIYVISVMNDQDHDNIINNLEKIISIQGKDNILILTDLFGSTPCNIASQFSKENQIAVISGLNLGMLIKSINYIKLPFEELVVKASQGGMECIKTCEHKKNDN